MVDEIIKFYDRCIDRNLCLPFVELWQNCKSARQYIDLSLNEDSIIYLAKAKAEGWGLPTNYIKDNFARLINGNYTANIYHDEDAYRTAELYCGYENIINTKADYVHIIDSNCTINVNDWQVLFIYVSSRSDININMGKNSIVYVHCYDECEIKHNANKVEKQ